jgi:hypothetical protein
MNQQTTFKVEASPISSYILLINQLVFHVFYWPFSSHVSTTPAPPTPPTYPVSTSSNDDIPLLCSLEEHLQLQIIVMSAICGN